MNWKTAPLPAIWPNGERTSQWQRQRARFRVGAADTMALLERELRHLGVRYNATVVIMAGYRERDIRLDGKPRADARPGDPAVAIAFESKYGPLTYACDTFSSYDDNLRAIALGLEALRTVDRYGITKSGQQYTGWKALGSGDATVATGVKQRLTKDTAADFLRRFGTPTNGVGQVNLTALYREALKSCHPDVGGSREDWDRLQEAKAVLGL